MFKGRGKGKLGKGKGDIPKTLCLLCNLVGHGNRDCWSNKRSAIKRKCKGKGKDGKNQNKLTSLPQNLAMLLAMLRKVVRTGIRTSQLWTELIQTTRLSTRELEWLLLEHIGNMRIERSPPHEHLSQIGYWHWLLAWTVSCAARSVVPAGAVLGYPIFGDVEIGRICMETASETQENHRSWAPSTATLEV